MVIVVKRDKRFNFEYSTQFNMRKLLLSISFALIAAFNIQAQTATDFTSSDCNGVSHHLFDELNSGKVIIIVWVMPCGSCVGPSLTANALMESTKTAHPNLVSYYMFDDDGGTNCTSLNSWKNSNNISNAITFSDSKVKMTAYGSVGMPKVVILGGGASHTVFYNANNTVDANAMQTALNQAMAATGIEQGTSTIQTASVTPNPASNGAQLKFTLSEKSEMVIDLYGMDGKLAKALFKGEKEAGENNLPLEYTGLAAGTYLLRIQSGSKSQYMNVVITQ